MSDKATETIGWCVIELMGHRRLAGFVRPVELAGAPFLRLDVPTPETTTEDGPWSATQYYAPSSVYCITPTTMETAVRAAGLGKVAPVSRWELPAAEPVKAHEHTASGRPSSPSGFDPDETDLSDDYDPRGTDPGYGDPLDD